MFGQSISQKIPIFGISIIKLFNSLINKSDVHKTILMICSSNNQNFICVPFNQEKQDYQIHKINDDLLLKKIDLDYFTNCISNDEISIITFSDNIADSSYNNLAGDIKSMINILGYDNISSFPISQIEYSTVIDFKGLENSYIIFCDIDALSEDRHMAKIYTGMTRARVSLKLIIN